MRFSPTENRTRGCVQCSVAGNPGSLGMTRGRGALPLMRAIGMAECVVLLRSNGVFPSALRSPTNVSNLNLSSRANPDGPYRLVATTGLHAIFFKENRTRCSDSKPRMGRPGKPRDLQCAPDGSQSFWFSRGHFSPAVEKPYPSLIKMARLQRSKVELQRSLQNTWSRRVDGVAEGRTTDIAVDCGGAVKLRVVEDVKCFYPEQQGF